MLCMKSKHSEIVSTEEAKANAKRIVKCVNMHDELIAFVEKQVQDFNRNVNGIPSDKNHWYNKAMRILKKESNDE